MEDKIQSLLLSWDEFNKKDFTVPYVYTVQNDGKLLIYCGVNHTFEENHSQFDELEKQWGTFIAQSGEKIAVGEGGRSRPHKDDKGETIQKYGEQGWLSHVAAKENIEIVYPDPSDKFVWSQLISEYSEDELFYYDTAQIAFQWNNSGKQIPFAEYVKPYFDSHRKDIAWDGYDFSLTKIHGIHKCLFKNDFDPERKDFFYNLISPSICDSQFNQLGRDIDAVRDTAIVQEIIKQWKSDPSVFVVFGSAHAVIQERALKTLLLN